MSYFFVKVFKDGTKEKIKQSSVSVPRDKHDAFELAKHIAQVYFIERKKFPDIERIEIFYYRPEDIQPQRLDEYVGSHHLQVSIDWKEEA